MVVKNLTRNALIALGFVSALPAHAQSNSLSNSFLVEALDKFQPGILAECKDSEIKIDTDFLGFTYVISPKQLDLTATPFNNSEAVTVSPPRALHAVRLFGSNNRSPEKWLIAWRPDANNTANWKCAWANPQGLLRSEGEVEKYTFVAGPKPLKIRDFGVDDQNLLDAKAVVHNLLRENDEKPRVYTELGVGVGREIAASTTQHSIFAFGNHKDKDGNNDSNYIYHLIGPRSISEGTTLTGWIRDEEVYIQPSLMSLGLAGEGFNIWTVQERTQPEFDAKNRAPIKGELKVADTHQAATQKHLVLGTFPDSTAIRTALQSNKTIEVEAYRVILPTQTCAEGECVSVDPDQPAREELIRQLNQVPNIDIVFLLDRTRSMGSNFTDTADAIRNFGNNLPRYIGDARGQVRIALYTYGDYDAELGGAVKMDSVASFTARDDFEKIAQKLDAIARSYTTNNYDANGSSDADKLEAPLDALNFVAANADWSTASKSRMIIHIFDHGSRDIGAVSGQNDTPFKGKTTVTEVVKTLNAHDVVYFPMLVLGDPDGEGTWGGKARKQARDQVLEIIKQVQATSSSMFNIHSDARILYKPATTQLNGKTTRQALDDALSDAQKEAQDFIVFTEGRIQCLMDPGAGDCGMKLPAAPKSSALRTSDVFLIKDSPPNRKEAAAAAIDAVFKHKDGSIAEFWVQTTQNQSGAGTVKPYVRMSTLQLDHTKKVFSDFCNWLQERDGAIGVRLSRHLSDVAAQFTGDDVVYSDTDTLAKSLSLPFIEKSGYLNRELRDLQKLLTADGPEGKMVHAFCATSELLANLDPSLLGKSYVVEQSKNAYTYEKDAAIGAWSLVPSRIKKREYKWFVIDASGTKFVELPFEYFP